MVLHSKDMGSGQTCLTPVVFQCRAFAGVLTSVSMDKHRLTAAIEGPCLGDYGKSSIHHYVTCASHRSKCNDITVSTIELASLGKKMVEEVGRWARAMGRSLEKLDMNGSLGSPRLL